MSEIKRLTIKLGSQCNWSCSHCHNEPVNYKYNPKLIDFIRDNNYRRITFSGGEPLLYWNTIVKIVTALGHNGYQYRIITNGSLLDRAKIAFISHYNISIIVSFDGSDGQRSNNPPTNWLMLSALKDISFSVVVYHNNMNMDKIHKELLDVCKQWQIRPKISLQPEFIHQTSAVNDDTTFQDTQQYCKQISKIIEREIVAIINLPESARFEKMMNFHTLRKALEKWYLPKDPNAKGIRCFTEKYHGISLDGRILLCPYNDKRVVGDIETGIDWDKIDGMIPEKCKKCDIFDVCRCSCLANITDNECYIAKTMNRWLNKVIEKRNCKQILTDLWKQVHDHTFSQTEITI